MRFSDSFIEQVRDNNDIVDLIGQYVQLQKAGSSYRGLCPFPGHAEKTPSFFVSGIKQLYHCFGCKKSGTVYNFLIDFQGLSFPEAVESLAQRARIPIPEEEKKILRNQSTSSQDKSTYLKLNRYAGAIFQKQLNDKEEDHPVKKYIQARGLTPEIVQEFHLGFAENSWQGLTDALKRGRAPLTVAEKLGLVKKKENGDYFDMFRERLIFPILSAAGDVVGFGGRSLGDQMPKYLNSPETPLFHKGKTLYGLSATAKYIRAQNEAFVVEGYMDLIALYQFGIKNVVATLGTAFTAEHARTLQKLCTKVVVLFDGDDAGLSAADKSLPIFLESGVFSRCLILPDGADPDDFLRQFGAEEFLKRATAAPDHFLTYLGRQLKQYRGQPTEKVEILNKVSPLLERVRDQRLSVLYLQEVADRLGVTASWITKQLQVRQPQPIDTTVVKRNPNGGERIPPEESILVRFMLQKSEYLERIRSSGVIAKFASEEARMAAQRIIEKYCQNPNDFDKLGASLAHQESSRSLLELLTNHVGVPVGATGTQEVEGAADQDQQLLRDCLMRVTERDLKIQSRSMLNSIKIGQDPSSEALENFLKLAKERKGPKNL